VSDVFGEGGCGSVKSPRAREPVIAHVAYMPSGDWIATLTDGSRVTLTHWQKVLWLAAQPKPVKPA
jgi:hypothetical protein